MKENKIKLDFADDTFTVSKEVMAMSSQERQAEIARIEKELKENKQNNNK